MTAATPGQAGEPRACDVDVWDGPYRMNCGLTLVNGRCITHGDSTMRRWRAAQDAESGPVPPVTPVTPGQAAVENANYLDAIADDLARRLPGCSPELLRMYALLALVRGTDVTLENVHDAWSAWRTATRPDHPSLVPFSDLAPDVQQLDAKYADAIRGAAAQAASDAAPGTAVYLNAIATLSAALREIKDCTGTSTEAHHIARKALDDADRLRPQRPAPELAAEDARLRDLRLRLASATRDLEEATAERDDYRNRLKAANDAYIKLSRERDEARAAFDDLTGQLAEARIALAEATQREPVAVVAAADDVPRELAAAMAEARTYRGDLDQATRLMLDLGSNELAASARRIRKHAGLED